MPLVSNKEEIELEVSHQEEEVEIEEACEEVEIIKEEHKGVELTRPLETSLPKSPSNTTFKWVKFLSLRFTFSLEYSLLENDGQLRALSGVKSKRELCSGWKHHSKFMMVACAKLYSNDWWRTKLHGSRKLFGGFFENSKAKPPNWNHDDQYEDGCQNKVWDPGSHKENQFWEPQAYEELHQDLAQSMRNLGAQWRTKHWWEFKDSFKHKPP